MRVACRLRELRGDRPLRQVAAAAGVNPGQLSEIERGHRFPPDELVPALEREYGAPVGEWYPPQVLAALAAGHDGEPE